MMRLCAIICNKLKEKKKKRKALGRTISQILWQIFPWCNYLWILCKPLLIMEPLALVGDDVCWLQALLFGIV